MSARCRAALVNLFLLIVWFTASSPAAAAVQAMTPSGWKFGGAQSLDDTAIAATATDIQGNTYVTGWSTAAMIAFGRNADGNDVTLYGSAGLYYVAKFDAAGRVVWAQLVSNELGSQMVASIALDGASPPNVYVGGWFADPAAVFGPGSATLPLIGDTDIFMMKLAGASGAVQWISGLGEVGATYEPQAMAVRPDGSRAYVVGCACGGNAFLARADLAPSGATLSVMRPFTGDGGGAVSLNGVALTAAGDVFVAGAIDGGDLVVPQAISPGNFVGLLARYDGDLATLKSISTFGGPASGLVTLSAIATDASSLYLTGWMDDGPLTLATANGPVTLNSIGGGANGFVIKASIADQLTSGNPGRVTWGTVFGGPNVAIDMQNVVAVDTAGAVYVGATADPVSGLRPDLTQPELTGIGTSLNVIALRLDADGRFTDGVAMGADGAFALADATGVAADGGFFLGGAMQNDFTVPPVAVTAGVSSQALMLRASAVPVTPPAPPAPVPPPPFVIDPPAATETAPTVGSGTGSLSFAASFANPAGLVFSASLAGGGALPAWLTFDPATATLRYTVPLPSDLPIQPVGDARGRDVDTRAAWPNTVYPPLLRVAELPVLLTATDRATGASFSTTVRVTFHAPREPVAISALSVTSDRVLGDRAAGRSALSHDGGQIVFETAATNLFPAAPSPYGDIVRYHGLSGARDRLSQTAIPGGGVANAANGQSSSPAVSADGAYGAFASDAAGISTADAAGRRQVYRVTLGYPRVPLNQVQTPPPDMVSATAAGIAGNGTSDNPSLSRDGRYVAFDSDATNLGAAPDGARRVWRKDMVTGDLIPVAPGVGPSLSWDGRHVAFEHAGRIQVKDLSTGAVRNVGAGASPRLSARADRVTFVSASRIVQVDLSTGATRQLGEGDQPAISADGRFVAYRAAAASGIDQIWIHDVDRSVTALVSQTAAGTGGNGHSLHPALSGDGSQVAFASAARDLVNGNPMGTQAYLAANPLPLPENTGYWYAAGADGGQGWLMERWGDKAYVGGLAYDAAGRPAWYAGLCDVAGMTCRGTLSAFAGGAPFGVGEGRPPVATPVAAMTLTTEQDGRSTTLRLGDTPPVTLTRFPIGGTATTGFAGLPQAGWWYEPGMDGGNGYFIAVQTQPQADGSVRQMAYVSVLTFDGTGRPVWYVAQAALAADFGFSGTLMQYAGGAPLGHVQGGAGDASPVGQLRIVFDGSDRARVSLPNGRVAAIVRHRF